MPETNNKYLLKVDLSGIQSFIFDVPSDGEARFKIKGIRNLERVMGEIIQPFGENQVAIDVTEGYKAQIAVAVLVGKAMNIPVYYKHERFSEIIDFPPLPILLDYDILGNNAGLLTEFERDKTFSQYELHELDDKLRVFLTEVEVEDEVLYELNAIGQLYLTSFRLRYPKGINLVLATEEERKEPTFGNDHHYPKNFKGFVNKVWQENNWIKTCYTIPYSGQQQIKGINFDVKQINENYCLVGDYKEKDFGARFVIRLTDESRPSLNYAAIQLNDKYMNMIQNNANHLFTTWCAIQLNTSERWCGNIEDMTFGVVSDITLCYEWQTTHTLG